ncbi:S8/S53 family peptidase [Thermocatellispora tengchongensis]|uniref:hypothetical protein n=1 Tax=Thermocatellispora tengchongensis TaxID=1073253 RepID=UPI003640F715
MLVRGEIADDELSTRSVLLPSARRDVAGVFADPVIHSTPTCGGDGPVGHWQDVARLLGAPEMTVEGHDGSGVTLAIVDSGINAAHVQAHLGREVIIDTERSWSPPGVGGTPGEYPVAHGTMCAFDALIAAPRATLLDIPVLLSPHNVAGLLSDAVAAYAHLRTVLEAMPAGSRSLVISNSWGLFSPARTSLPGIPVTTPTISPTRST